MAWKGDGNEGLSISGHSVQYGGGKGDAKGNALWTDQLASSSYVEFKVSGEPGTWVGVATEANFAAGWGLKGLFYGGPGNLSDGGSLVQSNWGPKFGAGDVIGMQVDQSADRVQIAFAKNGAGLGPAFDIAGWTAGPLHPTVSFNTAGQGVEIATGNAAPASMARGTAPGADIEGDWECAGFCMSVGKAPEPDCWRVSARVVNNLMFVVKRQNGKIVADGSPMSSTRMMGPEEEMAKEREVTTFLSKLTDIRRAGDDLVLEGAAGQQEVLKHVAGGGAATKAQINWMN